MFLQIRVQGGEPKIFPYELTQSSLKKLMKNAKN